MTAENISRIAIEEALLQKIINIRSLAGLLHSQSLHPCFPYDEEAQAEAKDLLMENLVTETGSLMDAYGTLVDTAEGA